MEKISAHTGPPVPEGHVRRTVAPNLAKMAGAHAACQPFNVITPGDQLAVQVFQVDVAKSVVESGLRTPAVSEPALGELRARPVDSCNQVLPSSTEPAPRGHMDEAYQ